MLFRSDELVTVADAELRHGEVQNFGIVFRSVCGVHAGGTATVDDALHAFQFRDRGGGGVDFGKHAQAADAVRNQVGVLPAKVQNGNSINVLHILSVIPAKAGIFFWPKDRNFGGFAYVSEMQMAAFGAAIGE